MRAVATVKLVTRVKEAKAILSSNAPPTAVLAIDAAPTEAKYRSLNELLVHYAKAGGIVVFGCNFSNHFSPRSANSFFRTWGVPWALGDYHRTTVYLNTSGVPGMDLAGLEPSYSVKALNVTKVLPNSAVYSPSSSSRTQSHVFPATAVDTAQAPAAYSAIGAGFMGYTGDVNAEAPTTKVIMAMLHLPIDHVGPDETDRNAGMTFGPGRVLGGGPFISSLNQSDDSDSDSDSSDGSSYIRNKRGTARGIPPRVAPTLPRPREAEVKARALRRKKGNKVFKVGNYEQAVYLYNKACKAYKPLPLYMSNLAAALIKLERIPSWDDAEMAADHATLVDPTLLKGYFRRGVARRHCGKYQGAIRDFERCLEMDPNCANFKTEIAATKKERDAENRYNKSNNDGDSDVDSDYEAKLVFDLGRDFAPERTLHVLDCPSDSEEYQHRGKGKKVKLPCRYYNHDGCRFGKVCRYKHAPDDSSIRDELCWYAHENLYLPSNGWWNEENLGGWQELYDFVKEDMDHGVFDRIGSAMNGTADIWRIRENLDLLVDDWTNTAESGSYGYSDDDDDDCYGSERGGSRRRFEREMEERSRNMGFTDSEVNELLCQGVKPWDDDAWDVMNALNSL
ncbi:hypothetical protein DFJ43DRAFT_1035816 [Lentinula guzmanii]|uniref:C3H1-type domain-containing protein n=1 Tax=Lentinula guzmanii TaxID=2804957 RepID=A0AA38JRP9_9AGAR|nr:hypothetical protein DFJ43DRAFT_1035816 [Lentinula guzmanii]